MSGVGPLEPGEGTRAWGDAPAAEDPPRAPTAPGQLPARLFDRLRARRRRTALAAAAVLAALLATGGYLYTTHEHEHGHQHERQPPPPAAPFPSQAVELTYLEPVATPPGAPPGSFSFAVLLSVEFGPPVTVTRMNQPYRGLFLSSSPRTPFRTRAGAARKIIVTMHVTECGKVPENAGFPFLDVTLRNIRAIQVQSFILGSRYAHALSEALRAACGNDSR
ncbi:hypothetical protein ABZ858_02535 [Streptomyces sp. NPDC047017]|uniref:hypothetical protein n=1 Tax=Streptomyces sp. NPDC047017 TaxID=3155024 RepID=UPI00340C38FA